MLESAVLATKTLLAVTATALVSSGLTSAFWLVAFNRGHIEEGKPTQREEPAPIGAAGPVQVAPSGLAIPVAGVTKEALADTFTQARSGGRVHDAIDIMAPSGTLVVAAAPGTVEKLFFSHGGGGITAYVRSPDRHWLYYYAHLQSYAPGLHEGEVVKRGDPIGRVGFTGNASPDGPHLHFAINRMEPDEKWWKGSPINPYPLLAGKRSGG
jgi:murein DD-endopeptidase MepM/ murein hydrolase activator NlpD